MSQLSSLAVPEDFPDAPDAVEHIIVPRTSDIGGFEVRRALPSKERRMVGPFVFLDQMGPDVLVAGHGMDVRPHPHIGLATLTYLFDGEIWHRDSLGYEMPIRPGALNLMTAGRGIVHSERSGVETRPVDHRVFGLQSWIALPKAREEDEPGFIHHPMSDLPTLNAEGKKVRVVLGSAYGESSPVVTPSETIYVDIQMDAGSVLPVPADWEERALHVSEGSIDVGGQRVDAGTLAVLKPGDAVTVRARSHTRVMIVGGEPLDGPRHLWWNFVSSSKDRLEQAKADWKAGKFPVVPGDTEEFIPLPE